MIQVEKLPFLAGEILALRGGNSIEFAKRKHRVAGYIFEDAEMNEPHAEIARTMAGHISLGVIWVTHREGFEIPSAELDAPLEDRLAELREMAEEEGRAISPDSEAGFRALMRKLQPAIRPAMFALENDNLRAVWRNLAGEQIGIQFLAENSVQFVLLVQRENGTISRILGQDTIEGVMTQVRSLGLLPLTRG